MRKGIALLVLSLPLMVAGQSKYYLSATGNDANSGTSPATPWQTITMLNTVTYVPGDSVFFQAGDTFRGSVTVYQSGSPTGIISFGSYGTGNRPVISGAVVLNNWTQHGDTFELQSAQVIRNFFVNDKEQMLARYPNSHRYLYLDSARTNYLLDSDLPGLASNLTSGSKLCVHTAEWCWEKTTVGSRNGDTLRYQTPLTLEAKDGFGYFLYDNIAHLDTAGEWKYVNGTQRLWYMPPTGQHPNQLKCEAAVYNSGIQLDNDVCYVHIRGLAFDKQGSAGVYIPNGGARYNIVDDCAFTGQYNHGVQDQGKFNEVTHNSFMDIGGIAVYVSGAGANCSIHHNSFKRIGMQPNGGIGQQINLSAIKLSGVDSCHVHHNTIDSTGYCGISADGAWHMVERNIIDHAMLWNNDGAGLHSWGPATQNTTFRNNFVQGSDGTLEGTNNLGTFITPGIYFDFQVNNCTVQENTIHGHAEKGIFQNSGNFNNHLLGNVVFGGSYLLDLNGSPAIQTPQTGFEIKHNTLFALDDQAYLLRQVDYTNNFNTGVIDSNYYFQPYNANRFVQRIVGFNPTPYSFSAWQATGNDPHTQSNWMSWTAPQNDARLFMNPSDDTLVVNLLDSLYLDLDSNLVCGTVSLMPYTSKVLINTLTLCNPNGLPEPSLSAVLVWPNPAREQLQVRVGRACVGAKWYLLSLHGQYMRDGIVGAENMSLDLQGLAAGVYLFTIDDRMGRHVVRVVKE